MCPLMYLKKNLDLWISLFCHYKVYEIATSLEHGILGRSKSLFLGHGNSYLTPEKPHFFYFEVRLVSFLDSGYSEGVGELYSRPQILF